MESFEAAPTIEQQLETESQEFVANFSETAEHLLELGNIQEVKPSNELKEKIDSIIDFFKRNNGANAKLVGFGLAVFFGKTAFDFLSTIDAIHETTIMPINWPILLKSFFIDSNTILTNLGIGTASVMTQGAVGNLKEIWSQYGTEIKGHVKEDLKEGINKLTQLINGRLATG